MTKKAALDRHLPSIRGPFDRARVTLVCRDETRAQQSFRDETNINVIMRKYERGQLIEHVNRYHGDYGDYTDVPQDYAEALNQVIASQKMFETLPAAARERFGNDPGRFLDFVGDPANADEMVKLGLAVVQAPEGTGGAGEGLDVPPKGKSSPAPPAPDSKNPPA